MSRSVVNVISLEAGELQTFEHDWNQLLPATTSVYQVDVTATDLTTGLPDAPVIYSSTLSGGISSVALYKMPTKGSTAYNIKLAMTRSDGMVFIDHYLLMADMDKTVYGLLDRALRLLGARNIGTPMAPAEQEEGLETLNTMLMSWSSERMLIQATTVDTFSTAAGVSAYTMGSSGSISAARAEKIESAFVRSGSTDFPLSPFGAEGYDALTLKATSKIPEAYFYDNAYPTGTLTLYPVPDAIYSVSLRSIKEVNYYSTVAVNHGLEGDYENSVSYSLAVHLAPKYGMQAAPEIVAVAAQSVGRLINERYGKLDATLDAGLLVT
jgi:hypothetical protein